MLENVWIIVEGEASEGYTINSVYATRELALAAFERERTKFCKSFGEWGEGQIEVNEVDTIKIGCFYMAIEEYPLVTEDGNDANTEIAR